MRHFFIFLIALIVLALSAAKPLCANTPSVAKKRTQILQPTQDFRQPEPHEKLSAGQATSRKSINQNAFSHPSANMNFEKQLDFRVGNGIFKRLWVSAPASTQAADGLGPLFNARSCQRCHLKDGRGHPPLANWPEDSATSMFLRLSIPPQNDTQKKRLATHQMKIIPEPTYGGQLQDLAIQGQPIEGRMQIEYEEIPVKLAGGETASLRKPTYSVSHWGYGKPHPELLLSPRVAPPMIGLGLLEAIPAEDILSHADPEDENKDGISGKPNWAWSLADEKVMLGRFGWKAGNPNLLQQSAEAFSGDIGISSPFFPKGTGDCTQAQAECLAAPDGNSPQYENVEADSEMLRLVEFYSKNLAVPARRNPENPKVLEGKKIFYQMGCTSCHVPKFFTQTLPDQPEQSAQLIWPYTDLLLHDMGEGLADHRPEGEANGREWRTPPLWGIGLTEVVNDHTFFLHDGRARNLQEAILWHGGEAAASKEAFAKLPLAQRQAVLAFLNSL